MLSRRVSFTPNTIPPSLMRDSNTFTLSSGMPQPINEPTNPPVMPPAPARPAANGPAITQDKPRYQLIEINHNT